MTSSKAQAVVGALMFIASVTTAIASAASLAGAPIGFSFVIPFGLMYVFIYVLRLQEWAANRKKPLADRVDQGQRGVKPNS